jgi:multimeric flavodoxin WrbA
MKRISILNGITDDKYLNFEKQLEDFTGQNSEKLQIDCFKLRDMDIKYCTGCWSCWLKTPGRCPVKDDMPAILKSVVHSDLVIFVSPVVMGFVSKYIKKVNDRTIPILNPYIGIFENEFHHTGRYEKYPALGLMLLTGGVEGEEAKEAVNGHERPNLDIITDIFGRMALNMKSKLAFSIANSGDMEVLANEMYRI